MKMKLFMFPTHTLPAAAPCTVHSTWAVVERAARAAAAKKGKTKGPDDQTLLLTHRL